MKIDEAVNVINSTMTVRAKVDDEHWAIDQDIFERTYKRVD